jgi:hypothetical protein
MFAIYIQNSATMSSILDILAMKQELPLPYRTKMIPELKTLLLSFLEKYRKEVAGLRDYKNIPEVPCLLSILAPLAGSNSKSKNKNKRHAPYLPRELTSKIVQSINIGRDPATAAKLSLVDTSFRGTLADNTRKQLPAPNSSFVRSRKDAIVTMIENGDSGDSSARQQLLSWPRKYKVHAPSMLVAAVKTGNDELVGAIAKRFPEALKDPGVARAVWSSEKIGHAFEILLKRGYIIPTEAWCGLFELLHRRDREREDEAMGAFRKHLRDKGVPFSMKKCEDAFYALLRGSIDAPPTTLDSITEVMTHLFLKGRMLREHNKRIREILEEGRDSPSASQAYKNWVSARLALMENKNSLNIAAPSNRRTTATRK